MSGYTDIYGDLYAADGSASFGSLQLSVQAAFGYAPYASPSWTEITPYVHKITIRRGAARTVTPRAVAGRCTLTLNNQDDRFDPNNTASPYYPDVVVTVPIRVQATWATVTYPVFYGFAGSWDVTYLAKGHRSVMVVPCVDGLALLNQHDISDQTYTVQDTDTRIGAVLSAVGWPGVLQDLDANIASVEAFAPTATVSAYKHLVDVAAAEVGRVFVAADGSLTFHNRTHHSGGASSEGTFGPATTDLDFDTVTPTYDDRFLYNDVRIKRATGTEQAASDATSITDHRNRTLSHAGIMVDDNSALNVAEWEVAMYKDVETRIRQVTVKPQADPTNLWPVVLGVDLHDSITVKTDPKGGGDGLNQQVAVESIRHDVTVDRWKTTYGCHPLSAAEIANYWILGTSNDLDTDTVLA